MANLLAHNNHVAGGHAQGGGGKTRLYTHFGGAKALFSHINLQATDSFGRGKTMQNFSFGAMPPVPTAGTCLAHKI